MDFAQLHGQVLAGKYRIEGVLGKGGMGIVLAARHLELDEPVAIKMLLPELLGQDATVTRFLREARAAVKIKSEHVARVVDVARLENGVPYMVMERLHGHDLAAEGKDKGPLPTADAVHYVLQACEAIAEAHAIGIVHRDIKPANLFLTRRNDGSPCVKVLDFGISKMSCLDTALTRSGGVMGSVCYMSPEQLSDARGVDARADVWSLGTTLFELLTQRMPFEAEELPALILRICNAEPYRASAFRPDLPAELDGVLSRALSKDRERRVQNVAELAKALAPFSPASALSVERICRTLGAAVGARQDPSLDHAAMARSGGAAANLAGHVESHPPHAGSSAGSWPGASSDGISRSALPVTAGGSAPGTVGTLPPAPPRRPRRVVVALAVALVVLVAGGIGVGRWTMREAERPQATSSEPRTSGREQHIEASAAPHSAPALTRLEASEAPSALAKPSAEAADVRPSTGLPSTPPPPNPSASTSAASATSGRRASPLVLTTATSTPDKSPGRSASTGAARGSSAAPTAATVAPAPTTRTKPTGGDIF